MPQMSRNRAANSKLGASYFCQPGPWGTLEVVRVMLSPPVSLTKYYKLEAKLGAWLFPSLAPLQVDALLRECGCSSGLSSRILGESKLSYTLLGTEIQPSPALILQLDPITRSKLYAWLANSSELSTQFSAFRNFGDSLDKWLEYSELRESTVELVRPYVYQHGQFLKFADLGAIIDNIGDEKEVAMLMKMLSREITLRVRLHLKYADALDSLVNYWGRNHRENDVRPILESFSQSEDEQTVDIVHLLPPLARKLLYTFPRPSNSPTFQKQTCYWTALNFFQETPDDRWLNLPEVNRTILQDWTLLTDSPTFGDVALFCDDRENAFHAAVYIADDILFTKNGPSVVRPWMFAHENYLRHFYYREQPLNVRYYRSKVT